MVELRLFKASLSSPEADRSNSSDAVTVREMGDPATSTDVSPIVIDGEIGADAGDQVDGRRRRSSGSTGADGGDDDDEDAAAIMCKSVSPRHYAPTALFLDKVSAHSEMQSSFADSGHFDDITCTSSVHSRDSYVQTMPQTATASATAGTSSSDGAAGVAPLNGSTGSLLADGSTTMSAAAASAAAFERSELIRFYELKIEDLIKNHSDESQEVRVTHNDRVEALLRRLAECNARYADAVPDHEQAKERIRELERQLEELQQRLQDQENTQNKTYLHMFAKGQEAERLQQADKVRFTVRPRVQCGTYSTVTCFVGGFCSFRTGNGVGIRVGGGHRCGRRRCARLRAGADAAAAGDTERAGEHKGDYLGGLFGRFSGENRRRLLQLLRKFDRILTEWVCPGGKVISIPRFTSTHTQTHVSYQFHCGFQAHDQQPCGGPVLGVSVCAGTCDLCNFRF